MRIDWKIPALIFGPLLFWSIPAYAIYSTQTHYWRSLLIPLVGFYPGRITGNCYWQHHALSENLITVWAFLFLAGCSLIAFRAHRKNSRLAAMIFFGLLTAANMVIYVRVNYLHY